MATESGVMESEHSATAFKRGTQLTCAICAKSTSFAELLKMLEVAHEKELSELRGENCRPKHENGIYDGIDESNVLKDKVIEENCVLRCDVNEDTWKGDESLNTSDNFKPDLMQKVPSTPCTFGNAGSLAFGTAGSSLGNFGNAPSLGFGGIASMESYKSYKSGFGLAAGPGQQLPTFQELRDANASGPVRKQGRSSTMPARESVKSNLLSMKTAFNGFGGKQSGRTSRRGSSEKDFLSPGVPANLSKRVSTASSASSMQGRLNIPLAVPRSRHGSMLQVTPVSQIQSPGPRMHALGSDSTNRTSVDSDVSAVTLMTMPGQNLPESASFMPQNANSALGKMLIEERELADKMNLMLQFCDSDVSLVFRLWAQYTENRKRTLKFQPLATWTKDKYVDQNKAILSRSASNVTRQTFQARDSHQGSQEGYCEMTMVRAPRCIVRPGSPGRIVWDLLGATLLMFDVIMIPMSVFNNGDKSSFETVMDWFTLIFWTFDMFASCCTGYIHNGLTVLNLRLIVRNYLRTWFVVDLIVVGPDWGFTMYEMVSGISVGGGGNSSKLLRALRVLRMCRMLRLVKLKRVLVMIRDRIDSENLFIFLSIIKMMVMMLLVNHFLASIWYAIGDLGRTYDLKNWIDQHEFTGKPLGDRYTTAYHWSLTQFSPASMDVQPHNVWERIYAITVLVCGLVLFSSFVSSVTASITQVRNREGDKSKQFWLLRRYLRQHGIQAQLTFRILRYIEYACIEQQNSVPETSIWVLQLLSHQLRNELNYSVSFSSLKVHPFFECTNSVSRVTMMRLSEDAMTLQSLACNDQLTAPGMMVDSMYMLVSGHLLYVHAEEALVPDCEEEVKINDWVCEPVLWTEWFALGEVSADTESRVVAVDQERFGQCVQQEYRAWKLASWYAKHFVRWLSTRPRGELTDVYDNEEMVPIINGILEEFEKQEAAEGSRDSVGSSSMSSALSSKMLSLATTTLRERSQSFLRTPSQGSARMSASSSFSGIGPTMSQSTDTVRPQ